MVISSGSLIWGGSGRVLYEILILFQIAWTVLKPWTHRPCEVAEWGHWVQILLCNVHTELQSSGITSTNSTENFMTVFHGWAAKCKPYITKHKAKCQVEWCKSSWHWTLEQWKCVLWRGRQSDKWVGIRWMPGEHDLPDCIVPTIKFRGEMMLWGCIKICDQWAFWTVLCLQLCRNGTFPVPAKRPSPKKVQLVGWVCVDKLDRPARLRKSDPACPDLACPSSICWAELNFNTFSCCLMETLTLQQPACSAPPRHPAKNTNLGYTLPEGAQF